MCEECGSEKRLLPLAARERLHMQVTVPEKIRSILSGGYESHVINYQFAYGLEVTQIYACGEATLIFFNHVHALTRFFFNALFLPTLTILRGNTAGDPGCLSPRSFSGFEYSLADLVHQRIPSHLPTLCLKVCFGEG